MPNDAIHEKALTVEHAPGEVTVSGPDGVPVSMTPEAAVETGGRLIDHATNANGEADMKADLRERRLTGAAT